MSRSCGYGRLLHRPFYKRWILSSLSVRSFKLHHSPFSVAGTARPDRKRTSDVTERYQGIQSASRRSVGVRFPARGYLPENQRSWARRSRLDLQCPHLASKRLAYPAPQEQRTRFPSAVPDPASEHRRALPLVAVRRENLVHVHRPAWRTVPVRRTLPKRTDRHRRSHRLRSTDG
jgi:hypothetical protein